MHVSVTRTRDLSEQPAEVAVIAGEEMLRWLRGIQGFEGLLMLTNEEGAALVLTFWESREVAEEHRAARMQLRDNVTSAVDARVEETVDYEVSFANLESPLIEPKD